MLSPAPPPAPPPRRSPRLLRGQLSTVSVSSSVPPAAPAQSRGKPPPSPSSPPPASATDRRPSGHRDAPTRNEAPPLTTSLPRSSRRRSHQHQHPQFSHSSTQTTHDNLHCCYLDRGTQTDYHQDGEKDKKTKENEEKQIVTAAVEAEKASSPAVAVGKNVGSRSSISSTQPQTAATSARAPAPPISAPQLPPLPTIAPRGRLYRTRSGSLVDAKELRRRKEQRERDGAALAMILDGVGQLSMVTMGMDEAGRWRIQRPSSPSEISSHSNNDRVPLES